MSTQRIATVAIYLKSLQVAARVLVLSSLTG